MSLVTIPSELKEKDYETVKSDGFAGVCCRLRDNDPLLVALRFVEADISRAEVCSPGSQAPL